MNKKSTEYKLQEAEYGFPYHHIPHFDLDNYPRITRSLRWGFEYLCYQKHIMKKVQSIEPDTVLEVGCGDGCFIGKLEHDSKKKKGIDISERAIRFAKAFFPNISFEAIAAKDLNNKFDLVVAIEVLEHIPDNEIQSFFEQLYSVTKSYGDILISVPSKNKPMQPKHFRHYDVRLFKEQLDQSGIDVQLINSEYIYNSTWWFKFIQKITLNNFWTFEVKIFQSLLWHFVWNHLRKGNEKKGQHLLFHIKKNS